MTCYIASPRPSPEGEGEAKVPTPVPSGKGWGKALSRPFREGLGKGSFREGLGKGSFREGLGKGPLSSTHARAQLMYEIPVFGYKRIAPLPVI